MLLVGCYSQADEPSIFAYEFDEQSAQLELVAQSNAIANASFLNVDGSRIWAVSEYQPENGFVAELHFDGQFELINKHSSLGAAPCHIELNNQKLYVSNYFGGNLVKFNNNLVLDGFVQHEEGSNAISERQQRAHIHSSILSQDGNYLITADLGRDELVVYGADDLALVISFHTGSGSGPRHMAWLGEELLVVNELNNQLLRLEFIEGQFSEQQSIGLLPDGFVGESFAAEVVVSSDQRFVYVSNRGHDSIAVFAVSESNELQLVQHQSTNGSFPRHFVLSANEDWLLVANQLGNGLMAMRRDLTTGLHGEAQQIAELNAPVNLAWL